MLTGFWGHADLKVCNLMAKRSKNDRNLKKIWSWRKIGTKMFLEVKIFPRKKRRNRWGKNQKRGFAAKNSKNPANYGKVGKNPPKKCTKNALHPPPPGF